MQGGESSFFSLSNLRDTWRRAISTRALGGFEDLEDKLVDITQTEHYCYRGFQLAVQSVLDKHFITIHSVELGKKESVGMDGRPQGDTSAYYFTSYLKNNRWLLNGRMGTGGTRVKVTYENGKFAASAQGNFADDPMKHHLELECNYEVADANIELKTSDFIAYGFCYTQPVTEKLGMGLEVYSTLDDRSRLKVIGTHLTKESQFLASWATGLGPDQVQLNYWQKVNPRLALFTSADFSFAADKQTRVKDWVSVMKVGYNYTIRDGDEQQVPPTAMPPNIRACADSTGNIAVFMEEPITEMLSASLSAKVNPISDEYDFGFGFTASL